MHESSARLREARLKAGFPSARAAAIRYGWTVSTYSSHENGQTPVPVKAAKTYAQKFKVSAAWILTGDATARPAAQADSSRPQVPLMGWAAGHEGADWIIRQDVQEPLPRPAGIPDERAVFALKVIGDSMEPAYPAGETVYIEQFGSPRPGDIVLIILRHGPHDDDRSGYIKKLVRRSSRKLTCEQFNPKKPVEFEARDVEAVYRVIPWKELLG